MPTTPEFTLTATLDDITGTAAGSTANPAKLRICLCGFGPILPRVAATAMVAKAGPMDFYSTGTAISTLIWGNDQIVPAGTYYSIEILDGEDNVVQCGSYVLTGAGGDLSSLIPIIPTPAPQPGALGIIELAGTIPGTVFTLPSAPYGGAIIGLFYRGVFYPSADNWTQTNLTVTTTFACTELPYALYVQSLPPASPTPGGLVMNVLAGTVPGTVFTLPTPPYGGTIVGLFYRGTFYPQTGNWALSGATSQTLTTTFVCTEEPYALYIQTLG